MISAGAEVIVHNKLGDATKKAYNKPAAKKHFHDLSIKEIEDSTDFKAVDPAALEFNDFNSHWIWLIQDFSAVEGATISKSSLVRAPDGSLGKSSSSAQATAFLNDNEVVLQLWKTQTLGKNKIRPEKVTLKLRRTIDKFYGSDDNISEVVDLGVAFAGSFLQLSAATEAANK